MEEGDKSAFFDGLSGSGGNIKEAIQVVEIIANNMSESTEMEDSDDNIPTEIVELLESHMASGAPAINNEDTRLICNQAKVEQQDSDPPEFFRGWEQSGSCDQCLVRGRKNKAHLNFNHGVSPKIQQLFEMVFKELLLE